MCRVRGPGELARRVRGAVGRGGCVLASLAAAASLRVPPPPPPTHTHTKENPNPTLPPSPLPLPAADRRWRRWSPQHHRRSPPRRRGRPGRPRCGRRSAGQAGGQRDACCSAQGSWHRDAPGISHAAHAHPRLRAAGPCAALRWHGALRRRTCCLEMREGSSPGMNQVRPLAWPRGMRVTFCTGSWPGVMLAHTAWPTCRAQREEGRAFVGVFRLGKAMHACMQVATQRERRSRGSSGAQHRIRSLGPEQCWTARAAAPAGLS